MECTVTLLWEIQDSRGKRWSRREENRICFATELIEVYGGTGRQWRAPVELKGHHLYGPDCSSSVSSWETLTRSDDEPSRSEMFPRTFPFRISRKILVELIPFRK